MSMESEGIFDSGAVIDSGSSIDSSVTLGESSGYNAPKVTEQKLDAGANYIAPVDETLEPLNDSGQP